jgi:hypothetical protein
LRKKGATKRKWKGRKSKNGGMKLWQERNRKREGKK